MPGNKRGILVPEVKKQAIPGILGRVYLLNNKTRKITG
jgi:hypothetical protein